MSDLHYDPYSEEALRDPYAIYKRLRRIRCLLSGESP